MTPADWNDRQPARQRPGPRPNRVLRQVGWAAVPIWSIGFLSFVPFLAYAVIQRRKRDWAVFAAYLAATVAMIIALGSAKPGADAGVGGFIIVLAGVRRGAHSRAVPALTQRGAAWPVRAAVHAG